jgi:hypothetical protein
MYFYGQSKEDAPGNHSVTINTAFESFVLSGLGWTTTPPTEPGWYWVKCDTGAVSVYLVNLANSVMGLYFESLGESWEYIMEDWKITHWLGPLPPPEPPKG